MKRLIYLLILSCFYLGCGKKSNPEPEREVGSNILYNRFQIDEKGNFFILRESGIKYLPLSNIEKLNFTELPFKSNSEFISGNKDTIVVNNGGVLTLTVNNKGLVEEIGKIKGFSTCDKFEKRKGLLFVLTGSSECNFGQTNPALKIYNLSEPNKITESNSIPLTDPKDFVFFDNNLLFIAEGKGGFKVFEQTSSGVLNLLGKIENKTVNQVSILPKKKVLIAKNTSEVLQFDYSNPSSPKLLSSIILSK